MSCREEQGSSLPESIISGGPLLPHGIGIFLVQASIILIVTRLLGGVLKLFKQPQVSG
jgi:hypothetical protein